MQLPTHYSPLRPPVWATAVKAFTLAEMMTTLAIFSLVVVGMVSLQIFGFKMNSFTSTKLKTTADSLKVLDHIGNQIREATEGVVIGNFDASNSVFAAVANSQPAIGDAVQISNGPADLVTFYLDTNTGAFCELENATNSRPIVLAHSVVNPQPFQAENCFGNPVLVGSSDHYTIKTTLQFSNLVYSVPVPTYDTYLLESRATPREQFGNN